MVSPSWVESCPIWVISLPLKNRIELFNIGGKLTWQVWAIINQMVRTLAVEAGLSRDLFDLF
jgi:hypothetical protein